MTGFKQFLADQGVVGVAVGLAIGLAAVAMIDDVMAALVTPIIERLAGSVDLAQAWVLDVADIQFKFGMAIDAILKFLIVAFVIYFVVNKLGLDKLDAKKKK